MRLPARPAGLLLAWGALAALPGCAPPAPDGPTAPGAQPPAAREALACASEAEQLLEPVTVHAAPAEGATLLLELARGRFVYRCERRGTWLAIMFPAPGEALDCSHRPPTRACPTGWVQGDLRTAIFG